MKLFGGLLIIRRSDVIVTLIVIGLFYSLASYKPHPIDLRSTNARNQIKTITQALDEFRKATNRYPTTAESLSALVNDPGVKGWHGPYIQNQGQSTILDPWGNPFQYESPGRHGEYDLYSYGRDGKPGGWGKDGDIKNWE